MERLSTQYRCQWEEDVPPYLTAFKGGIKNEEVTK